MFLRTRPRHAGMAQRFVFRSRTDNRRRHRNTRQYGTHTGRPAFPVPRRAGIIHR